VGLRSQIKHLGLQSATAAASQFFVNHLIIGLLRQTSVSQGNVQHLALGGPVRHVCGPPSGFLGMLPPIFRAADAVHRLRR